VGLARCPLTTRRKLSAPSSPPISRAIEDALTDGFRFTSPYDDGIDKATYFVRCWRDTGWIERHELEKIFVAIPNSSASPATSLW
jgi:hypothetical protein